MADGPHGVRKVANVNDFVAGSLPATCFPTASCVASSWDIELIHSMGEAIAEEGIALNRGCDLGSGSQYETNSTGRS